MTGSVSGGGLADTISIGTATGAVTLYGDAPGVTPAGPGTGGGADGAVVLGQITSDSGAASIYGGAGADTIKILAGTGLLHGGDGNDSIYIAGSAQAALSVNGGAGADNINIATAPTPLISSQL